jgi:hypothetical protein
MYATCLFCNKPLGSNEAIEHFPVGRRLAFDAAKGRLWVVCPACERWNLTPLEERWEAIEDAERLYRGTRLRAATDQIGLARLRDGTELVRIGEPLRPEFAAWRYGDQFGRRRRRQMLIAGAGITAITAVVAGGVAAGVGVGGVGWLLAQLAKATVQGNPRSTVARIRMDDRQIIRVRLGHLSETTLDRGSAGPIALDVRHDTGYRRIDGPEAMRVASMLMPKVNRYGGTKQTISQAVTELDATRGSEGYLDNLAGFARVTTQARRGRRVRPFAVMQDMPASGLFGLNPVQRLAFEMALHEEAERRALDGELAELEAAWREAEEIAAISDNLLIPVGVEQKMERLHETSSDPRSTNG